MKPKPTPTNHATEYKITMPIDGSVTSFNVHTPDGVISYPTNQILKLKSGQVVSVSIFRGKAYLKPIQQELL